MGDGQEPADTRMMGIVHGALHRDLVRIRTIITNEPYPQGRQRRALGEHVVWLMEWLHEHHTGEDEELWPLVRKRNPQAGPLLDSMEVDHQRIEPATQALTATGRRYAATTDDRTRTELITAMDQLTDVLFPHLELHIQPKSPRQLAMVGLWLIDGIDREGYRLVVAGVSPVTQFVLKHGFGRAYRRQSRARWQPDPSVHGNG